MTDFLIFFFATLPIFFALFWLLMRHNAFFYSQQALFMVDSGNLQRIEKMLTLHSSSNLDFEGEPKKFSEEINQKLHGNVKALIPHSDGLVYDYCSFELALALDTHSSTHCYWSMQVAGTCLEDNITFVYQTEMRIYIYDLFSILAILDIGARPIPAVFSRWINLVNPWRDNADLVDTIVLLFVWRRANWNCSDTCKAVSRTVDFQGENVFCLNTWIDLVHDRIVAEQENGNDEPELEFLNLDIGAWRIANKEHNVDLCDCSLTTTTVINVMLDYLYSIRPTAQ